METLARPSEHYKKMNYSKDEQSFTSDKIDLIEPFTSNSSITMFRPTSKPIPGKAVTLSPTSWGPIYPGISRNNMTNILGQANLYTY